MIKLERKYTPIRLNPILVSTLTDKFKKEGTNVWNVDWLKKSLLSLSYGKCSYCECNITEESKYMEVEHFEDKDNNPDKVLEWNNLLPSCKRCNGSKSTHDVIASPIINPFVIDPKQHLYLSWYRFKEKDLLGKATIEVVNLNHAERAIQKRFEVGEGLEELIDIAATRLTSYVDKQIIQRKNKLVNIVEEILKECIPESIYAGTCATVLHKSIEFNLTMKKMKSIGLWTSENENLFQKSKAIQLI